MLVRAAAARPPSSITSDVESPSTKPSEIRISVFGPSIDRSPVSSCRMPVMVSSPSCFTVRPIGRGHPGGQRAHAGVGVFPLVLPRAAHLPALHLDVAAALLEHSRIDVGALAVLHARSEEHTSELQSHS